MPALQPIVEATQKEPIATYDPQAARQQYQNSSAMEEARPRRPRPKEAFQNAPSRSCR